MTTALPTSAASQATLTPVLSPEQKELQGQIGTPQTWLGWAKEKLAAGYKTLMGAFTWAKGAADVSREKLYQYIGSNPQLLEMVKGQAEKLLDRPEVQAKLKLVPTSIQKELLHAAIEWSVKAPGAQEKWNAIKEKYGPVVTDALISLATTALGVAVQAAWEAMTSGTNGGTVRVVPMKPMADGFSAR